MRTLLIIAACVLLPRSAQAQIAHGATGTGAQGTTSLSVSYPAGVAAGNLLVLCVSNKYPANGPATPSGWTLPTNGQGSGGSGSAGEDSGEVYATVFVKVADGSESGSLAVTITSGNAATGAMSRYTKTLAAWSYAAVNGVDSTVDTSWSVTAGADPGVTAGDMVYACSAVNGGLTAWVSPAITQTGITWGTSTERIEGATANGDNVETMVSDHAVSSGTSSAAPVYTMTGAGSGANSPAGATVLLRLREVAANGCSGGLSLLGVGKCE